MSDVAIETRPCPDCGKEFTGPVTGRGSIAWKLGAHRSQKHGYVSPKKRAKPEAEAESVIVGAARQATSEFSDRSTKAPTIDELSKAGARFFGTLSIAAASYAAETDPTIAAGPAGEADREALVDYLALDRSQAEEIAYPFARAFGRSKANARFGRAMVDNIDVASAVAELGQLGMHWRRYLREREARAVALGVYGGGPAAGGGMERQPPFAPPPPPATPPGGAEMSGVVISADMLRPSGNGNSPPVVAEGG